MNRREFCSAMPPLLLVGCGSGDSEMPQEFTLQPSPIRTNHLNASPVPGYGSGTWTPSLTFITPGDLNIVFNVQVGSWTKIGNTVTCMFSLQTSTFTHTTASGNALFSGFPFPPVQLVVNNGISISTLEFRGITKANYTQFYIRLSHNVSIAAIGASGSGQIPAQVTASDMPSGGTVLLVGTISYPVRQ